MSYAIDYALVDGQHPPNCAEAKAAGASMVIIRGAWGYRGTARIDPTLARDAINWRTNGVRVGAYLFLDYETDPAMQAATMIAAYVRGGSDLPVALDLEMDAPPPGTTPASRLAAAEKALVTLQAHYGARSVMIYTSLQQWLDHFGDLDSAALGACPLWLKTPYAWNPRNPPKLDSAGPLGGLPRPWRRAGSPSAWLQQFQGDALGWPGMSSTVDVSRFLPLAADDARWAWVRAVAGADLPAWQRARGLVADGIPGPATFAALCRG